MKTLTLLRHAKSGWDDPVARDFDRPLNQRGMRAARLIGEYARARQMRFDHIVASPAARVAETLDHFAEGYGRALQTQWDRRIYLASAGTLIDVLGDVPDGIERVLMVGHNPGLEELALTLATDDEASPLWREVERKFPTAALAAIELDCDRWADVARHRGRIVSFTRPRDLDPALGPETY